MRFLDLGEDVTCAVSASSTKIRPVNTSSTPGLQALIDNAIEDGLDDSTSPDAPTPDGDPYSIVPFERWATGTPPPQPAPPAPQPPLAPGQNLIRPDEALTDLTLTFGFGGADADLTLLLLGPDHRVRTDSDFVFYNQPLAAHGAARLLGKTRHETRMSEQPSLRLAALPHDTHRVIVSINMDVDTGQTCAALHDAALQISSPTTAWTVPTPADPHVRAMILAEFYRHAVDDRPVWKLRAVG
jgi:stress response protein SCP2